MNLGPMTSTRAVTVLEAPSGQTSEWAESMIKDFRAPESLNNIPKQAYLFMTRKAYPRSADSREKLLEHFNVPAYVANQTCFEVNGFFGSRSTYDDEKKLVSYTTWFRILVKMIRKESRDPHDDGPEYAMNPEKDYQWYETTIFTRWDRGPVNRCQALVVDAPSDCAGDLLKALKKQKYGLNFQDPFAMHALLIDQLATYCDVSVWRIRDPVRNIEKARMRTGEIFGAIHEISRHAIHSSEVLEAGVDTLKELHRCQIAVHNKIADELKETYTQQAREYTEFQITLLKNLKLRADSNRERLKNEINLAYNNITRQDNTVLKSIALLTMIFLPATFISSFFSTTFFSYGETRDDWQVSDDQWVYWATTIPATLFIILCWWIWLTWADKILNFFTLIQNWVESLFQKQKQHEVEHQTFNTIPPPPTSN
ncbi:hypothetical protein QBC38DRAFT_451522 [Podospora fimiseda]|uniref:Uncharacterized protein n=1 Tax=Podospora fimiseda TaxID=252190 RepID=A0AAN7BX30_9PEZI|nr:hypothetical protein QBC38DRAFT_451522 [Podospora fimiseda]